MTIFYAQSAGKFDAVVWDENPTGGTPGTPASGDDCDANGFIVEVDVPKAGFHLIINTIGGGHFNATFSGAVFPAEANTSDVETAYGPNGDDYAGSLDLTLYVLISGVAAAADVRNGTARYTAGPNGTCYVPAAADVRFGVNVGATTGTCKVPTAAQTLYGIAVDVAGTGTVTLPNTDGSTPDASQVRTTANFGAGNATAGTLDLSLYTLIAGVAGADDVRAAVDRYTGGPAGNLIVPAAADLHTGVHAGWHHTGTPDTWEVTGTAANIAGVPAAGYVTLVRMLVYASGVTDIHSTTFLDTVRLP